MRTPSALTCAPEIITLDEGCAGECLEIHPDTPFITEPMLVKVAAPGVSVLFLPVGWPVKA